MVRVRTGNPDGPVAGEDRQRPDRLKLGCRDRAQLVVVAYETGVAIPGRQLR